MSTEVSTLQKLTASRMRSFKTCRRADYYRYELRIRPTGDSHALKYGTHMHKAIEILESGEDGYEQGWDYCQSTEWRNPYDRHTLANQFAAYAFYWHDAPIVTIAPEQVFYLPLYNPSSRKPSSSRTWERAGKFDAVIEYNGKRAIREIKTTSEDPQSDRYWRRLLIDPQVSHYFLAARDLGMDIEAVLFDVIRKPCISPALATPPEKRKYTKEGNLYANQRETDESPEEWGKRLFADMLERPTFYMERRLIPRLEADLDTFSGEMWDVANDIRNAQLSNRWYRNAGRFTCDSCPYFDPCTGLSQLDPRNLPDGWSVLETPHPELES